MRTLPRWVLVPAALGALLVVLPVVALVLRTDPRGALTLVTSPAALDALGLSLGTAGVATVACVVLGAPLALVLARTRFPGQRVVRALVLLPLVLPPVVGGLALLHTFGRRGLLGAPLELLGVQVPFTTVAVVLAQTFVALPFLVLGLEGALRTLDDRVEDVAATLGAGPTTVLRRVTLPRVLPGLASGAVLAFARALGEFGATITFAGALPGVTQTLPLEIYLQRSADPDAAVALAVLLVVVALAVTVGVHATGAPASGGRHGGPGDAAGAGPAHGPGARRSTPDDGTDATVAPGPGPGRAAGPVRPAAALRVAVRVPDRGLDVTLDVAPGQVVAVLGENGAGKSTLLAAVAGLVPAPGEIRVDDVDVTRAPPRDRHVGWVGQRPLLLEHLTVLDDVAFGPRSRGAGRRLSRERAAAALGQVGAGHLAARRGHALSGGQAQRVALARALATEPRLLLLDEPFAALDVGVAARARTLLLGLARAAPRTTLLVTHDLLDVLVLADRVVVLADGRVVEDGPVAEVLARPRSAFAARLAGVHLVTGTVVAPADGHAPDGAAGGAGGEEHEVTVDAGGGLVLVGTSTEPLAAGEPAAAVVEPRAVAVHTAHPTGSPRNVVPVRLTGVEPSGALVRVHGTAAGGVALAADLTPRAVAALGLTPGTDAWFTVKAAELTVHARPAAPAPGATLVG